MKTPSRLLVAWLPAFRLERCGWRAHERVVLVAPRHGVLRVQSLTPGAVRVGLRVGMSAPEARALVPDAHLEHLDSPEEEAADLADLALQLEILSPRRTPLAPDAIALEIGDTAGLLGGEAACMEKAVKRIGAMGHTSRAVIVDGHCAGAARAGVALAQWGDRHRIVPPDTLEAVLVGLPLGLLSPPAALMSTLVGLGVHTAGQLAALSAASVANRFGADGLALHDICRATPVPPPPPPALPNPRAPPPARASLPAPTASRTALEPVLQRLVEQICAGLCTLGTAAVRLQLRLGLDGAPEHLLSVRLGRPQREPTALTRWVLRRLEDLQLPAPVVAVEVEVLECCPHRPHQASLLTRQNASEPLPELLARLEDALGPRACFVPQVTDTWRPEDTWQAAPFGGPAPTKSRSSAPRPALLLPIPRPIQLRQEEDPTGKWAVEIEGRWSPVRHHAEVERLEGAWWAAPYTRDYLRLELVDGRQPWVFRDRKEGSWWLHGWFE